MGEAPSLDELPSIAEAVVRAVMGETGNGAWAVKVSKQISCVSLQEWSSVYTTCREPLLQSSTWLFSRALDLLGKFHVSFVVFSPFPELIVVRKMLSMLLLFAGCI